MTSTSSSQQPWREVPQRIGPLHCPACWGEQCKGGGNKKCVQRDPKPSRVAAILDTYGGVRTVVAYKRDLKNHTRHDEICVVVPNLRVHEPIAWGDIPFVIERARLALVAWCDSNRSNEAWKQEAIAMFRLRELESPLARRSLNLDAIAVT